jgi:DNA-binding CsgD family transcriptional regulator
MLARNELGHRLAVLIVLGNGARAERLAASLSGVEDVVPILAGELHADDAIDVTVVDEEASSLAAPEGSPQVLLASGPVEFRDRFAAILPAGAEPALIAAAARLAAAGYHVVAGARAARAGGPRRDPEASGDGRDAGNDLAETEGPTVHLSPREAEVLALLAEGAPNKVIARRLDISVHTAKFHVAAILVKLGAANRTDAIATAMRQGLVLV